MSTHQPKISIVIPVYNVEAYLYRCLKSIQNQTFVDFEAILVDDGSIDKSGSICDEYANNDERFKVIHKINGGVSIARQTGLDAASGDYVIHADPDDWVEPEWLQCLYEEALRAEADMVICGYERIYKDRTIYRDEQPTSFECLDVIKDLLNGRLWGPCWNKLIRRSCFQKYQIKFHPDMNLWEDVYVVCMLLLHDIRVSHVAKYLYHYDSSGNIHSITKSRKDVNIRSSKIFIDTLEPLLKEQLSADEWYVMKLGVKRRIFLTPHTQYSLVGTYPEINKKLLAEAKIKSLWSTENILAIAIQGHRKTAIFIYNVIEYLRYIKRNLYPARSNV